MTDPSCLFCRIVVGEIPSAKVHEDELVLAFDGAVPVTSEVLTTLGAVALQGGGQPRHQLVQPLHALGHAGAQLSAGGLVELQVKRRRPGQPHALVPRVQGPQACHVLHPEQQYPGQGAVPGSVEGAVHLPGGLPVEPPVPHGASHGAARRQHRAEGLAQWPLGNPAKRAGAGGRPRQQQ